MMKKTTYIRMTDTLKSHPVFLCWMRRWNSALALTVVALYGMALLKLLLQRNPLVIPATAIPAVSYVLLTIARGKLNAKRPYEVFAYEPALPRHKEGKSFPSRHIFSAFVIGITLLRFWPVGGGAVLVCGAGLAIIRVAGGVHFVKDVVWGAVIGILCGMLMFLFR